MISYLREFTIEAISQFLIVKGAMLSNCRCVGAIRLQDLIPPVDVVLLYQLLFVLIEVLGVGDLLLKGLIGETSQEILLQVGCRSGRRPVMQMVEL